MESAKSRLSTATLDTWHSEFPDIEVTDQLIHGHAGHHLFKASTRAGRVVAAPNCGRPPPRPNHPFGDPARHLPGRGGAARLTVREDSLDRT